MGDEAVFKVLRWTGGNFELNFEGKTDQETTKLNTQGLLMEGLRLLDESQRDAGGEAAEESSADASADAQRASEWRSARAAAAGGKRKMMSSSTTEGVGAFTAAVVTVSDSCSRGERVDLSGPAVVEVLKKLGFRVVATQIVQDDSMQIQNALVHLALEVPPHRNHRRNGNCAARCHSGSHRSDLRSSDRRRGRTHAARRRKENYLRRVEPGSVRRAGEDSDPESAGQSQRRGGVFGSRAGFDSACAEFAGREHRTQVREAGRVLWEIRLARIF